MPEAGASARPARRYAAPWWEELDRDAFRFPAAREAGHAAASRNLSPPARTGVPRAVRGSAPPRPPAPAAARSHSAAAARSNAAAAARSDAPAAARSNSSAAARNLPMARPTLRRHERPGFQPDRAALWAVLLGLCLILVAAASAHGAVLH